MIERILVPTDGSELSERAIPLATVLASAQGAQVFLAQAVSPPAWMAMDDGGYGSYGAINPELYQQLLDEMDAEARENLDRLASSFQATPGVGQVQTQLFHGSPHAALLDYEQEIRADLVVLATHGRTGLARFALGSVADRMVREGAAPVLMVRSFGREVTAVDRALVPLDGSSLSERSLPMVEALAGKPLHGVTLLTVADGEDEDARMYLDTAAVRLRASGLTVDARVLAGDAGEVIAAAADEAGLIIMATHGRSSFDRVRHGSIAEQVLHDSPVPLLLVRAREDEPDSPA